MSIYIAFCSRLYQILGFKLRIVAPIVNCSDLFSPDIYRIQTKSCVFLHGIVLKQNLVQDEVE